MPRGRYSFRTTRKTKWLEDILEEVEDKDRADFIRCLMEDGCRYREIHPNQVSDKSQTDVIRMSGHRMTPISQIADIQTEEPVFNLKKKKVNENELESRLNNLYK